MKNRPRLHLSQKSLQQLPNGKGLDVPTRCELGCMETAAMNVNGVRICLRHYERAMDIARDAKPPEYGPLGRQPLCTPQTPRRAVA